MTILPQEVWYANFPFQEDNTQSKDRPVIVLDVDDEQCKVLSMKVKSAKPRSKFEIEIFDWAIIPLDHKSTADASSVQLIPKGQFRRKAGQLSDDDWDNVTSLYAQWLKSTGVIY